MAIIFNYDQCVKMFLIWEYVFCLGKLTIISNKINSSSVKPIIHMVTGGEKAFKKILCKSFLRNYVRITKQLFLKTWNIYVQFKYRGWWYFFAVIFRTNLAIILWKMCRDRVRKVKVNFHLRKYKRVMNRNSFKSLCLFIAPLIKVYWMICVS